MFPPSACAAPRMSWEELEATWECAWAGSAQWEQLQSLKLQLQHQQQKNKRLMCENADLRQQAAAFEQQAAFSKQQAKAAVAAVMRWRSAAEELRQKQLLMSKHVCSMEDSASRLAGLAEAAAARVKQLEKDLGVARAAHHELDLQRAAELSAAAAAAAATTAAQQEPNDLKMQLEQQVRLLFYCCMMSLFC